jgi:hypothetical protein
MTAFLGNIIAMAISGGNMIKEPAAQMFVYASLMFLVMAIFIYLSIQYQYVDPREFECNEENDRSRVKWSLNPIENEEEEDAPIENAKQSNCVERQ